MAYKRQSPMPIIEGGTNASSYATVDGTTYYDGTRLVVTATGTAGQVLTSNGAALAPSYQTVASVGVGAINIINSQPLYEIGIVGSTSWYSLFATQPIGVQARGQFPMPVATTFSNFYVYITTNASTIPVTITFLVNSVATAITVTVPALTTGTFIDSTHTASVSIGDLVQVQVGATATGVMGGTMSILTS